MNSAQIDEKLRKLDGRGTAEEFEAVQSLSALGDKFPILLLQRYRIARNWAERASCVYHATKYARTSDAAFQLGIEAIADRSKKVRYRACLLLAVAQKREAIPHLASLVPEFQSADVTAAIDAIEHGNQNYFTETNGGQVFPLAFLSRSDIFRVWQDRYGLSLQAPFTMSPHVVMVRKTSIAVTTTGGCISKWRDRYVNASVG